MSTDDTERKLEEDIRLARQRLVVHSNALLGSVKTTLDVMAPVRRHPLAGVAAGLSTGVIVGSLGALFSGGKKKKAGLAALPFLRTIFPPARAPLSSSLLMRFLPLLAPAVVAFARQRFGRHPDPHSSH